MYKLLFAEDESATRNGILESIDWNSLGIRKVQAEKNGALAFQAAEEGFCPDILLTDIKMPRMDGIELSRKIRSLNPQCSILIISGYAEVDYLKSAIQLKAINFVDKPIKLDELTEQIRRAVNAQDELREKKELLKMEIGSMLRYSGFSAQKLEHVLRQLYPQLPASLYSRAVLIRVLTADGNPVPDSSLFSILSEVQAVLRGEDSVCIPAIHKSCIQLSLFGEKGLSCCEIEVLLNKALPQYRLYFCEGTDVPLAEYEFSLKQTSGLLPQIFYNQDRHLLTPDMGISLSEPVQLPDLQPLSDLLLTKDREKVKHYIQTLLNEMSHGKKRLSPDGIAEFCFRILLKLIPKEDKFSAESNRDSAAEWLTSCVFLDRMEKELLQEVDRCFDSFGSDGGSSLIDRVLVYIKENYCKQELSLNLLSQQFYVSNVYLCVKFKEKVGKTFVRYLTELRIQKASQMLRENDLKINTIAENVGFDNGSYFTKIFKREVGMTPAEYRKFAV